MLIATDDAGCVLSLVAFTYRNCSSILLGSLDVGVALDLGAALDGAGGVFGGVAFTDRYGGNILLFCLDVGVALDLDSLRIAGTLGLLSQGWGCDEGERDEHGEDPHWIVSFLFCCCFDTNFFCVTNLTTP